MRRPTMRWAALALLVGAWASPAWAQAEAPPAQAQAPSLVRVLHGEVRTRDAKGAWVRTAVDVHAGQGQVRVTPVAPIQVGVLGPVASILATAGQPKLLLVAPGGARALAIAPATLERVTEQRGLNSLLKLLSAQWQAEGARPLAPLSLAATEAVPGLESAAPYGAWRLWRLPQEDFPRKAEYEDAGKVTLIWEAKRVGAEGLRPEHFQAPAQVVDAEAGLGL